MANAGENFSDFIWSYVGGQALVGDGRAVPASTPLSLTLSKTLKAKGVVGPQV